MASPFPIHLNEEKRGRCRPPFADRPGYTGTATKRQKAAVLDCLLTPITGRLGFQAACILGAIGSGERIARQVYGWQRIRFDMSNVYRGVYAPLGPTSGSSFGRVHRKPIQPVCPVPGCQRNKTADGQGREAKKKGRAKTHPGLTNCYGRKL